MNQNRNCWLDIAKGIAIILLILLKHLKDGINQLVKIKIL